MTDAPITQRMRSALAAVWLKSRDRMFDRVAVLENAAMHLLEAPLSDEQRREAERAAHQLAGTCGTFGFAGATELAREAEQLLAGSDPIASSAIFRLSVLALALREQLTAGVPGITTDVAAHEQTSSGSDSQRGSVPDDAELVLALDDDPQALHAIDAVVSPAGYRVVGTTDPNTFTDLLESMSPVMVILDVDMPGASGVEMCRRLRADARYVALPVLFLTARTDAESVARLFEAGADDYTAKPVVGPELVARIRNRLERSRLPRASSRPAAVNTTTDVVLVEDDVVLVGLLERSLATIGYSVTSFGDGPSALKALVTADGALPTVRARVIVLDVGLPGMNGLTVLRALARGGVTRQSRVVMLTARTSEQETVQALELGAFDHVAKPFSVPILIKRIQRAFDAAEAGG